MLESREIATANRCSQGRPTSATRCKKGQQIAPDSMRLLMYRYHNTQQMNEPAEPNADKVHAGSVLSELTAGTW